MMDRAKFCCCCAPVLYCLAFSGCVQLHRAYEIASKPQDGPQGRDPLGCPFGWQELSAPARSVWASVRSAYRESLGLVRSSSEEARRCDNNMDCCLALPCGIRTAAQVCLPCVATKWLRRAFVPGQCTNCTGISTTIIPGMQRPGSVILLQPSYWL